MNKYSGIKELDALYECGHTVTHRNWMLCMSVNKYTVTWRKCPLCMSVNKYTDTEGLYTLYLGVNNYTTLKKTVFFVYEQIQWHWLLQNWISKSQCSFLHKTRCLCNYCPCGQNYYQLSPLRSVLILGIKRPLFRSLWKESVNNDGQQSHHYQQENCMFESPYHIIIHISIPGETSSQENVSHFLCCIRSEWLIHHRSWVSICIRLNLHFARTIHDKYY